MVPFGQETGIRDIFSNHRDFLKIIYLRFPRYTLGKAHRHAVCGNIIIRQVIDSPFNGRLIVVTEMANLKNIEDSKC